jgi:transglutaminase-like putative cysteine protease
MRLKVEHRTSYRYEMPMRFVTQSHRLTPADHAGQRVIDWSVAVEGASFGAGFVDGAGDRVGTMTLPGPVEAVEVVVQGTVETADTSGVLRQHRELIAPQAYLVPTGPTAQSRPLVELKDRALAGAGTAGVLEQAHRLAHAVAEAIEYSPGATEAHTTAAEALAQGRGVCQDHAHALIALAHAAGLPARYVVGYLFAGAAAEPYEANHAWAEIHVAGLGWVGFDPANRCCPDERYLRLGSGRDARAAAPIRGVSRGAGPETLDVSVVVAAAQL